MIIANEKEKENIAEYILYMWHIEDLIRAYNFDINVIYSAVIQQFNLSNESVSEMKNWYLGLIDLMEIEGIKVSGHLAFVSDKINQLQELHNRLINNNIDNIYRKSYYEVLPSIIDFKQRIKKDNIKEVEICLTGLYEYWLLKASRKPLTENTQSAFKLFGDLIAQLVNHYHKKI